MAGRFSAVRGKWLTPSMQPGLTSRAVLIPGDPAWLAAFWGAFMLLTDDLHWQQRGTLTPEETAAAWYDAFLRSTDLQPGLYYQRLLQTRPDDLIAYWRLNECTGTTAGDSSGNGHHATASGVTWGAAGIDGATAARFDGVNDLVNVFSSGLAAALNINEGTFVCWLKPRADTVWNDGTARYLLNTDSADHLTRLQFLLDASSTALRIVRTASQQINLYTPGQTGSNWRHLAVSWSTSANALRGYIDGVEVPESPKTGLLSASGATVSATLGYLWDGDMAHAALWSCPLSPFEIAALAVV